MKRDLLKLSWLWLLLILAPLSAISQTSKKKGPDRHDCSGICFGAEVISVTAGENGCTNYEMRVTHDGACRYELSHMVVEMPCGFVRDVDAPGGCGNEFGKDPTTGLRGLKIDDVRDFGKGPRTSFTFKFTWCNSATCNSSDCWEPRVAFKAASCVDYDTARNSCQAPPLIATVQKQNSSCSGKADGTLSVSIEGGQGPYTYNWSTGCDLPTIDNLPAGTYTITVTDSQGNEVTVTEQVIAPSPLDFSSAVANPTCSGAANGSIDLSVTGGVAPYAYLWSNGATIQDLTNIISGTYKVIVTDSLGCSKDTVFILTNPVIATTGQTTRPGCGQSNGQINITVTGGTAPYTFAWSNGASTEDLTGVATGSYSVTVTDANACTSRTTFFLAENNTLNLTFQVTPTNCVDDSSGAINLTVTGGTPPYTYAWMNGSTSEDLTGLAAGLQAVTVTDAVGCRATRVVNVFKNGFQVPSQIRAPSCSGLSDGSITLSPNGVPPFTYLWSNGSTSSSISNLSSGLYFVTVTDNTGCSQQFNYFLQDPVINAFTVVTNPNCGAEGDFAINLTVGGGVAPYTFDWSNGETSQDISGLNSGAYSVTITDANGCGKTLPVVIQPIVLDWSCTIAPPVKSPVSGTSGNLIGTSVTGATAYNWSVASDDGQWTILSGQNAQALTYKAGGNGSSGTFTLSITKNSCTQTCSYTVSACSPVISCGVDTTISVLPPVPPPTTPTAPTTSTSDTTEPTEEPGTSNSAFKVAAYPNPVVDKLSFGWTAEASEFVQIELIDQYGRRIAEIYSGDVQKGDVYHIDWNASHLNDRVYFYRFASGARKVYGKIFKGD